MGTLQLERNLRYAPLAWIEVTEAISYQAVAVGLALAGFGIWALVWATLLRGAVGTGLIYLVAPWPLRPAFDVARARLILRYGLRFQGQIVLNQTGNWVTPLLVGSLAGSQAVGLLGWATSNGRKPLLLVDNVMRVFFPHVSRLQHDVREVERILVRYLTYLLLPAGLWLAAVIVAAPALVPLVYTQKWAPGIPALALYSVALVPDAFNWTVGMTLNGLGRVSYATVVTGARNAIFVGAAIPLLLGFGYNGVPIAYLLAGLVAAPLYLAGYGEGALQRVLRPLAWAAVPTLAALLTGLGTLLAPLHGLASAVCSLLAVAVTFTAVTWWLCPPRLLPLVRSSRVASARSLTLEST
jgi:O-antigen/teichoic acid export membrane protein